MVALLVGFFAYAGENDRFSNIDLEQDNPRNTGGQKPGKNNSVFTKDNSAGDQELFWDNNQGVIQRIGGTKSLNIPLTSFFTTYGEIVAIQAIRNNGGPLADSIGLHQPFFLRTFNDAKLSTSNALVWSNGAWSKTSKEDVFLKAPDIKRRKGYIYPYLSPAVTTFTVPDDYQEGGFFRLKAQQWSFDNSYLTQPDVGLLKVGYNIYRHGAGWSRSPISGSTVLARSTNTQNVDLTLGIDQYTQNRTAASAANVLAAGDLIELRLYNASVLRSSDWLKIYSVQLLYD